MKVKTTRKAIVNGCLKVRYEGYCGLQYLLRNHEPFAYTYGVYGWNFDVYEVYGLTICTGYRGMPGKRLVDSSRFEKQAEKIWQWDYPASYEQKCELTEALLKELCELNK